MNTMEEDDILEVNLGEILYQLIHKLRFIILAGVICGIPVFISMEFLSAPVYISSTTIAVNVDSAQLSDEYAALAASNEVLEGTLEELQLNYDVDALRSKISASIQANTRILHISASDQKPEMAKRIADTVREHTISLIRSSRGINEIRVLNEANLPKSPAGTSIKKAVVFMAAVGACVAASIIILMTLFRSTICTPEEVKRCIGLNTLGVLPMEMGGTSAKRKDAEKHYISEACNALRANLLFCGEDIKSIGMVSCSAGEGTTSVIQKLALSLSDLGKNVLVVYADMRRPAATDCFQAEHMGKGLSDYLSGNCSAKECIVSTAYEHLYIFPCGAVSENPTRLLSDSRFNELMPELKQMFDYVLIDCPSLSGAIDGAIIAKACDASAIVLESGKVKRCLLRDVKEQLERANPRILGVVLNKFNVKKYKCYGNYFEENESEI